MIVTIRDPEILNSLEPEHVCSYLRSHHWQEQRKLDDAACLWSYLGAIANSEAPPELLLPLKPDFLDFPRRMAEVLHNLEIVEQRSQLEILSDLFTTASNFTVQGIITTLQEGLFSGKITLMGIVINKLRRIQLELNEPAYELAVKAYQARIPILCQGTLIKRKQSFVLQNPTQFTLDLDSWTEPEGSNVENTSADFSPQLSHSSAA